VLGTQRTPYGAPQQVAVGQELSSAPACTFPAQVQVADMAPPLYFGKTCPGRPEHLILDSPIGCPSLGQKEPADSRMQPCVKIKSGGERVGEPRDASGDESDLTALRDAS